MRVLSYALFLQHTWGPCCVAACILRRCPNGRTQDDSQLSAQGPPQWSIPHAQQAAGQTPTGCAEGGAPAVPLTVDHGGYGRGISDAADRLLSIHHSSRP